MGGESAWSERSLAGNRAQVMWKLDQHHPTTIQWNRIDDPSRRDSLFRHPSSRLSPLNAPSDNGMKMLGSEVVK